MNLSKQLTNSFSNFYIFCAPYTLSTPLPTPPQPHGPPIPSSFATDNVAVSGRGSVLKLPLSPLNCTPGALSTLLYSEKESTDLGRLWPMLTVRESIGGKNAK
jgi:hypothetical protein